MDICKNAGKIVSLTKYEVKVWSLSTFKLEKMAKLRSPAFYLKIVEENVYLSGIDPYMQVIDLKKLECQCKTQNKGTFSEVLSISVVHGLLAFGLNELCLYNIKTQTEVCFRNLGSFIISLVFVQCYILCGTVQGKLFYLNCFDLALEKCFKLKNDGISFVSSSKDLNILAYSTENKSFLLDFERNRIIYSFDMKIDAGIFMENQK